MGYDGVARLRVQLGEGQVFQLLAHVLHADAPRQRGIDVHRLLGDAAALVGLFDIAQRAHVVQPVGQLDQKHADVAGDGQHEFAEILRLLGALGKDFQLGQFGDAIDQIGDLVSEFFLDVFVGYQRVFNRVMKQRGDDGGHIQLQVRKDGRHFQRVGEIRIARRAELLAVRRHGIDVCLVEQVLVGAGIIGQHPLDQVGLAHQAAAPADRRHMRRRRAGNRLGGRLFSRRRGGLGGRCHAPNIGAETQKPKPDGFGFA